MKKQKMCNVTMHSASSHAKLFRFRDWDTKFDHFNLSHKHFLIYMQLRDKKTLL